MKKRAGSFLLALTIIAGMFTAMSALAVAEHETTPEESALEELAIEASIVEKPIVEELATEELIVEEPAIEVEELIEAPMAPPLAASAVDDLTALFRLAPNQYHKEIARVALKVFADRSIGVKMELRYKGFEYVFGLPSIEIGSKTLADGTTLVVLNLEGTTYQVGTDIFGYLIGFFQHWYYVNISYMIYANKAWGILSDYLKEINIKDASKVKLLVAGHSLGGACANVVGMRLAKETINGMRIDHAYVYGFETPTVYYFGPYWQKFDHIYNLINASDMLARLMPGQRFGTTYEFTSNSSSIIGHGLTYDEYLKGIDEAKPAIFLWYLWPFSFLRAFFEMLFFMFW